MKSVFGIIGGDKRQLYLAKSLEDDGYTVYVHGFELSGNTENIKEESLQSILNKCDNIILPLPCTRDGKTIFAPYSEKEIIVDDNFIKELANKSVYGGYLSKLVVNDDLWESVLYGDYYLREELAISNAIPTAEGAIALAVTEYEGIINGSKCLITGFGRIGKILTKILLGMGANVSVAVRKSKDMAMVRAMGATPIKYSEIKKEYALIFNTVPEIVINASILAKQSTNTVIIELASSPGGIDREAAAVNEVKIVEAQSLPGKFSAKATAEFIKETIYNMMEE